MEDKIIFAKAKNWLNFFDVSFSEYREWCKLTGHKLSYKQSKIDFANQVKAGKIFRSSIDDSLLYQEKIEKYNILTF